MIMPGVTRPVDKRFVEKKAPAFNADKFLDHPAKEVIDVLSDLDQDRLRLVLEAEKQGKDRSTVIKAIDIELAKQGLKLSDELAEYMVSLSSFKEDELRGEVLIQADCPAKLRLVQEELAERASA